jgi:hypothetical protein
VAGAPGAGPAPQTTAQLDAQTLDQPTDNRRDAVTDNPVQLTREDLKAMTPEAIDEAHSAGRCDLLLGIPAADVEVQDRARSDEPLTRADVAQLRRIGRPDLIFDAHEAGRITYIEETP